MALTSVSPRAYRRITLFALVALATIVVTGAAVRLTGSGLGCTDWPTCSEGRLAPTEMSDAPAMIEFTNRVFTGVVSAAVGAAVLGSLVRVPRRRDLTWLSIGLVVGVLANAALGGLVVLFHLSPKLVMGHFLLSMLLLWNGVVLHHRAGRVPGAARPVVAPAVLTAVRALFVAAAVVVFTGTVVTASGPHAGDTEAARLGLHLPDVARVHGGSVIVLLTVTLVALWLMHRTGVPEGVRTAGHVLLAVVVAQAGVGYVQYFTGVPALIVGIHIIGAIAVWTAVVHVNMAVSAPTVASGSEGEVTDALPRTGAAESSPGVRAPAVPSAT